MRVRAIVFDKDDTLIDLAAFWREPVRQVCHWLAGQCLSEQSDGEMTGHFSQILRTNASLVRALCRAAGFDGDRLIPESPVVSGTNADIVRAWKKVLVVRGLPMPDDLAAEARQRLEDACAASGAVVGMADFRTLLPRLAEKGLRFGVVTSDSYLPTVHCLQELGIADRFDAVLTADRVPNPKPAPDMMTAFCRACGVQPGEVLMVGDSDNDMLFAKNSGATGVLFRPGPRTTQPDGASYRISDLNDLPGLVGLLQALS